MRLRFTLGRRTIPQLLSPECAFSCDAGTVTAILGASGAGKTTLLRALAAGRTGCDARVEVHDDDGLFGEVHVEVYYIEQDPIFFSNLTVEETLSMKADLLMEHYRVRPRERRALRSRCVDLIMRRFGLISSAGTLVGGKSGAREVRGISGGERKRLAIAMETIPLFLREMCADPHRRGGGRTVAVILADEPTSGLDSWTADQVMQTLQSLCEPTSVDGSGPSPRAFVIASIHQPRAKIMDKIDQIVLLANAKDGEGGAVVFSGGVMESLEWFRGLGHTYPEQFYSPTEFLLELTSVDVKSRESEDRSRAVVQSLRRAWEARVGGAVDADERGESTSKRDSPRGGRRRAGIGGRLSGALVQFGVLMRRTLIQTRRDHWVNIVRGVATVSLALIFGGMNKNIENTAGTASQKCSVVMSMLINSAFLSVSKNLHSIPRERTIVLREMHSEGGYGVGPYLASKMLVEVPCDALYPLCYAAIVMKLSNLDVLRSRKRAAWMISTMMLTSTTAAVLGFAVGASVPKQEMAMSVGPVLMLLSVMMADTKRAFSQDSNVAVDVSGDTEGPGVLARASNLSMIKWGFEGAIHSEFHGNPMTPTASLIESGTNPPRWGTYKGILPLVSELISRKLKSSKDGVCVGDEVLKGLGCENGPMFCARRQLGLNFSLLCLAYTALRLQTKRHGAAGGIPVVYLPTGDHRSPK